jgi:hypothetical protein
MISVKPRIANGLITMSNNLLRMSLGLLTAAVMVAEPAHAALYDGDFDPLIFNGTATFQIGDGCLAHDGIRIANFGGCTPVDIEALPSPVVNVVNGSNTSTLNFSGFTTDSSDMLAVAVIDGQFAGIDTLPIGGFRAQNTSLFPDYYFLEFLFTPTFSSGNSNIETQNSDNDYWNHPYLSSVQNSVLLFDCPTDYFSLHGSHSCSLADTATRVTFAQIPEPGSLALIAGALGVGWWTRRRKSTR